MNHFKSNIKHLRKEQGLTQADLAERIGIKRSLLGAYEEGRAEPRIDTLRRMAAFFHQTMDGLIDTDLTRDRGETMDLSGTSLRILPVVVTPEGKERVTIVPVKAAAGYTSGYGDPDFISSLPQFTLPLAELPAQSTARLFQIDGDSMLPIPSGSYIIATYIEDWRHIKNGTCCIVVTRDEGIVYKRVINRLHEGHLELQSDNTLFHAYEIDATDILEIWQARAYISLQLPDEDQTQNKLDELRVLLREVDMELKKMNK